MASLVIRPEKIGDLIVTTPVFRALKESFPGEPVHLLVDDVCADLVKHDPHLDRIIRIPWKGRRRGEHLPLPALYAAMRRNGPYRRALILYPWWNPWNWLVGMAGVKEVAQLGGTWSALLWRHRMMLRKAHVGAEHMSELYLQVAAQIGANTLERNPRLHVTDEEKEKIVARFPFLREPGKIFVHAFSLTASANLSPRAYFDLGVYLAGQTFGKIHLIGTQRELDAAHLPRHSAISTELVGSLNLRELMAALSCADLVIGGSSGIIHVAAALGVPTLGLYCPGDSHHDQVWGPKGPRSKTLSVPASLCKRANAPEGPCQAPAFCDLAFAFPPEMVRKEVEELMSGN